MVHRIPSLRRDGQHESREGRRQASSSDFSGEFEKAIKKTVPSLTEHEYLA